MIDTITVEIIDNGILLENNASTMKEAATYGNDGSITTNDEIVKLIGRNVWSQLTSLQKDENITKFRILIDYNNIVLKKNK